MKNKLLILFWTLSITTMLVLGIYPKFSTVKNLQNIVSSDRNQTEIDTRDSAVAQERKTEPFKFCNINDIQKYPLKSKVGIIAKITNIRSHEDGHIFLTLGDTTGTITVPIFKNLDVKILGFEGDTTKIDQFYRDGLYLINGLVDTYKNKTEIIPASGSEIIYFGQTQSNEISKSDTDNIVERFVKVNSKKNHKDGHLFLKVSIYGNGQQIDVPIFNNINFSSRTIGVDSVLKVKGTVSVYRGNLQIIPQDKKDIKVLNESASGSVKSTIEFSNLISVNQIDTSKIGQTIKITGRVSNIYGYKGHHFFDFNDGTGTIRGVLFSSDINELPARLALLNNAEQSNFPVTLVAKINEYKGELQLIVDKIYR